MREQICCLVFDCLHTINFFLCVCSVGEVDAEFSSAIPSTPPVLGLGPGKVRIDLKARSVRKRRPPTKKW